MYRYSLSTVYYFPDTRRIFCINEKAKELIESVKAEKSKEDILLDFGISETEYKEYYNKIFTIDDTFINKMSKNKSGDDLSRLVIHITNDCNMRCKYCYANGGHYLSQRGMLQQKTLDKCLEVFFSKFNKIYSVQFFGGEPLLNMDLLEYACQRIHDISQKRNYKINFGIVTNATLITEKFIELVNKYNISVTISYDGNPEVNNIVRCLENGANSTELILENAKKLSDQTGQPDTIEVTYNKYHVEKSVGILDVVKHIHKELPNAYIHLVPAGGSEECEYAIKDLSMFKESVREIFSYNCSKNNQDEMLMYSLIQRIVNALNNKQYRSVNICDAGIGTISVAIDGSVYPCFMFTDNDVMSYGNIFDKELFKSEKYLNLKKDRLSES